MISKWLQLVLMLLCTAICIAMTGYVFNKELQYAQFGKTAVVHPEIDIDAHSPVNEGGERLAVMKYTDVAGREVQFKRYLDSKQAARFARSEPVQVYYLPGEWNTEQFSSSGGYMPVYVLAFLGGSVYVIRRPCGIADRGRRFCRHVRMVAQAALTGGSAAQARADRIIRVARAPTLSG